MRWGGLGEKGVLRAGGWGGWHAMVRGGWEVGEPMSRRQGLGRMVHHGQGLVGRLTHCGKVMGGRVV